ncbi:MAG TPA: hypothetical protein DCW86_02675 [Actinobacteria bacterium]|nr:hypothetical protein [Actinomycetota bacterium]
MKNCWNLKGCPASYYLNCAAYEKRVSCWEIKEGCLCRVHERCEDCPIYIKHLADVKQSKKEPS